mgnify:CR=1 FL=1
MTTLNKFTITRTVDAFIFENCHCEGRGKKFLGYRSCLLKLLPNYNRRKRRGLHQAEKLEESPSYLIPSSITYYLLIAAYYL